MTVRVASLFTPKLAENAQTTQYTSAAVKTIIDKFTVSNITGVAATFALNLVQSGGAASTANLLISRTIQPAETYLCPEVTGHIMSEGGFISTLAGTASALSIQASGRTVS